MARNRHGRKSLYEVMTQQGRQPSYGKTVEKLRPPEAKKAEPTKAKCDTALPQGAAKWWRRPKPIQINAGRIEISIPYQLAIALLLGLIALVLFAFRLGQFSQRVANSTAKVKRVEQANVTGRSTANRQPPAREKQVVPREEDVRPAESTGDHWIVIQTYPLPTHLEPVKKYFAQAGIDTEIRKIGNMYYLRTQDKYENPQRKGTDGYEARQRIIQLGANYKAPPGYEPFGPKSFETAYGMKSDD
jgi:hypothetical protein